MRRRRMGEKQRQRMGDGKRGEGEWGRVNKENEMTMVHHKVLRTYRNKMKRLSRLEMVHI